MLPTSLPRRGAAAAATGVVLLALVTGCGTSSGGDSESSGGTGSAGSVDRATAPEQRAALRADGLVGGSDVQADTADAAEPGEAEEADETTGQQPMVIRTGTVSLRAGDVSQARFEVQKVVDRAGGEITDEKTRTGDDGDVADSRLVLRIPSERFDEAMQALEGVAELEASTTDSEDVTTQVIDTRVRIRVQRASIRRIEALLSRARDIGTIMRIEAQLSRRQSTLNSLLRRQAYLADQTTLATVTVHLERLPADAEQADDGKDATGFVAGLESGWGALAAFGVGLATVLGAVLPWLPVLLVLGLPAWVLLRRQRRTPPAAPTSAKG